MCVRIFEGLTSTHGTAKPNLHAKLTLMVRLQTASTSGVRNSSDKQKGSGLKKPEPFSVY